MIIGFDGNEANITQRVGVNQLAYELLRHLIPHLGQNQLRVLLKDRPLPDMPQSNDSVTYEIFGPTKMWVLTGLTKRLFKKPKLDVLFSPSHYIPLVSRVKQVFAIMDLSYEKFGLEYFKNYDLQQLRRWTKLSVKKAHKIITISQSAKQDILDIYKVKADRVEVIYPGFDSDLYHARIPLTKQLQVREKYGIRGKYFLFVGTLQPRKNISRLIEAFAVLGGGTKLVVVGKKGWLYDQIFQQVTDLGLTKKVIFTGFAPSEDLPALYKGAVAFVLPSLYEGFGIPVIEAQASGALTVVSSVSSLPEIAGPGSLYIDDPTSVSAISESLRAALSLPKKDRLNRLLQNKLNVARFSWNLAAQQLLTTLTTL